MAAESLHLSCDEETVCCHLVVEIVVQRMGVGDGFGEELQCVLIQFVLGELFPKALACHLLHLLLIEQSEVAGIALGQFGDVAEQVELLCTKS